MERLRFYSQNKNPVGIRSWPTEGGLPREPKSPPSPGGGGTGTGGAEAAAVAWRSESRGLAFKVSQPRAPVSGLGLPPSEGEAWVVGGPLPTVAPGAGRHAGDFPPDVRN